MNSLKSEILRVMKVWKMHAKYPPVWYGYKELEDAISIKCTAKELKEAMQELKKEKRVESTTLYTEDDYCLPPEGWVIKEVGK